MGDALRCVFSGSKGSVQALSIFQGFTYLLVEWMTGSKEHGTDSIYSGSQSVEKLPSRVVTLSTTVSQTGLQIDCTSLSGELIVQHWMYRFQRCAELRALLNAHFLKEGTNVQLVLPTGHMMDASQDDEQLGVVLAPDEAA